MSRTYRNKRFKMKLGAHLTHKEYPNGKVRDGTPQHVSKSCENNKGCNVCEGNRLHSTNKRKQVAGQNLG